MTKQQQQQQPITPPHELIEEWIEQFKGDHPVYIAIQAAQWGADQELEACCEWLHWQNLATHPELIPSLRAARRPKQPSLKEQALEALERQCLRSISPLVLTSDLDTIRRALEALPND